jgi:hypothetical protein
MNFFEDCVEGKEGKEFESHNPITAEEIKAFAKKWDPQQETICASRQGE